MASPTKPKTATRGKPVAAPQEPPATQDEENGVQDWDFEATGDPDATGTDPSTIQQATDEAPVVYNKALTPYVLEACKAIPQSITAENLQNISAVLDEGGRKAGIGELRKHMKAIERYWPFISRAVAGLTETIEGMHSGEFSMQKQTNQARESMRKLYKRKYEKFDDLYSVAENFDVDDVESYDNPERYDALLEAVLDAVID